MEGKRKNRGEDRGKSSPPAAAKGGDTLTGKGLDWKPKKKWEISFTESLLRHSHLMFDHHNRSLLCASGLTFLSSIVTDFLIFLCGVIFVSLPSFLWIEKSFCSSHQQEKRLRE